MILLLFTVVDDSDFCDGWEDGYVQGYCYQVENCNEPLIPLCPLPEVNEDTFTDGYNRGFLKGLEDQ